MTDDQVERLIWKEIKKRDITIYDMTGMPNCSVDPHPEDTITAPQPAVKRNLAPPSC
jgi:hypothetical protein